MNDEPVELDIPGYRDAELVGRGGFGAVYRAFQSDLNRTVAIKVIVVASIDAKARARFERERQSMGALSTHPAIVTVHETGMTPSGLPYLVMEFMEGGSFGDVLRDHGPLPWARAVEVGIDVAGALEAAHRAGVVHRDVKPDNVLVSSYDEVKLTDFGIASLLEGTSTTTSISGTIAHAAPEVLEGAKATVASDVYSLGSTIFALLAGSSAFHRPTDESLVPIITRVLTEPVPDLRPRGIPNAVCSVIERAMAKEPTDRYGTAHELGEALAMAKTAAASVAVSEVAPPVVAPVVQPEPRPDPSRTVVSGDLEVSAAESATKPAESTLSSDVMADSSGISVERHSGRGSKRRPVLIAGSAILLLLAVLGPLALLRNDGGEASSTVLDLALDSVPPLGATTTSTPAASSTTSVDTTPDTTATSGPAVRSPSPPTTAHTSTTEITGDIDGPNLARTFSTPSTQAPNPPTTQPPSPATTQAPTPPTTQPPSPPTTQTTTLAVTTTTSGLVQVPDVVGLDRLVARSVLGTAGFAISEDRGCYGGGWAAGQVVYQVPFAGTFSPPGSTVSLDSQFGPAGCSNTTVNSVVGLTEADAVASITANTLVPQVVTGCFGGATPGIVVSQSPAAGSSAPQGWPITLNVQAAGCT